MPNADGAGYYRFIMSSADLSALRSRGLPKLTARERYALLYSLLAGFESGSLPAADLLASFTSFAEDPERLIAVLPMNYLYFLQDRWLGRPSLSEVQRAGLQPTFETFVKRLYGATAQRLGLTEGKADSGDVKLLRARVLGVMCDLANDTPTRMALARAGRQALGLDPAPKARPEALTPELLDLSVRMLVEQGDEATFDAVYQSFKRSNDATERARYLSAHGSVFDGRSDKALALALDPALRVNEVMIPLRTQLGDYRTRAAAYAWFESHFDALEASLSPSGMGNSPWLAVSLCDQSQAARVHAFFAPRVEKLPGAPRGLEGVLEQLQLCDALLKAHATELDAFFSRH
jgi:alanyl aminopeptidase